MKRFITPVVIVVFLIVFLISYSFEINPVKSYVGERYNANVPKEKEIVIDGNKILLKYDCTVNNVERLPKDRIDKYGTYDEYIGDDGKLYIFLHNTDLLCGFLSVQKNQTMEALISEEEAKEISKKYLEDIIGADAFGQYVLEEVVFDNGMYGYVLRYYYSLGNMKTDDEVVINICYNGDVIAFSGLNLQKYKGVPIHIYDISLTDSIGMNYLYYLNLENFKIQDKYISMKHNGDILFTFEYSYTDNGVAIAQRYCATMVKKIDSTNKSEK